jgi:hypothetical protein
MAVDYEKARRLCTQTELALVESARAVALRPLTARAVRLKARRARELRDKFRNMAVRQSRAARAKERDAGRTRRVRGPAVRTASKADLFDEVLRRFEARAAELEASPPPASARSRRPARTPGGVARSRPARSQEAATLRKAVKLETSHVPREHAHVSSRNKRGQAVRDSRSR